MLRIRQAADDHRDVDVIVYHVVLLFEPDADDLTVPDYERDDCERIVSLFALAGVHCTLEQAHAIWDKYSDGHFAGWMDLPRDDVHLIENLEMIRAMEGMSPPEQWPPSLLRYYALEEVAP